MFLLLGRLFHVSCDPRLTFLHLPHSSTPCCVPSPPLQYVVSSLITNEMHDLRVVCTDSELIRFQPPSGQTCAQWAGSFLSAAGGYLANENATADCGYCQYRTGDDYYASLDIKFSERGRNIGIFIAFIAFNGEFALLLSDRDTADHISYLLQSASYLLPQSTLATPTVNEPSRCTYSQNSLLTALLYIASRPLISLES